MAFWYHRRNDNDTELRLDTIMNLPDGIGWGICVTLFPCFSFFLSRLQDWIQAFTRALVLGGCLFLSVSLFLLITHQGRSILRCIALH